jgi:hypothetical protein
MTGVIRDVWPCMNTSITGTTDVHNDCSCGQCMTTNAEKWTCSTRYGWACAVDFERVEENDIL